MTLFCIQLVCFISNFTSLIFLAHSQRLQLPRWVSLLCCSLRKFVPRSVNVLSLPEEQSSSSKWNGSDELLLLRIIFHCMIRVWWWVISSYNKYKKIWYFSLISVQFYTFLHFPWILLMKLRIKVGKSLVTFGNSQQLHQKISLYGFKILSLNYLMLFTQSKQDYFS